MKEEVTKEMHKEFSLSDKEEKRAMAGVFWSQPEIDFDSTEDEIKSFLKGMIISYEDVMLYKQYWKKRLINTNS